jgi:HPt (histidine-containing phosphotransfer) domain-containing protein
MIVLSTVEDVPARALLPAEGPIDLNHLSRMTLGDRSLEREVLALFDRQSDMLLARIRAGDSTVVGAAAHTLKGSALGIGAWCVARAAEAVEQASTERSAAPVAELATAVHETRRVIAGLLAAH